MPDHVFSFINAISTASESRARRMLADQGFDLIEFDGAGVNDKASFLARADIDLPRPVDLHPHNWDAFADTLSNGLDDLTTESAIIWTTADAMIAGDLQDFLFAVDVIVKAARGADVPVLLVLVGDGPGFRSITESD